MRFVLNGNSIKVFDREEIAQNFNDTDILRQFKDGSLSKWLNDEVGEDDVASGISDLNANSPDEELIDAIIEIMGLDRKQIEDARMRISAECEAAQKAEVEERNVEVVDKNTRAKQKLVDLANQGNASAQYKVGENFYYGKNGFRKKEKAAIKWWKRAAEQGHAEAIKELDKIEELAKRYEKLEEYRAKFKEYTWGDKDERKTNMNKLLDLACQGDVESQFLVAESFYYGVNGFNENQEKAIRWYQKAAELGYEQAVAALREINDF